MIITYVARRSLIGGHVAGTEYQLTADTTSLVRTVKPEKITQRAIGGAAETLYFRTDREWSMTFAPLRGAQLAALLEFLDSTERGETFRLTLPGEAVPGTICRRTDDAYTLAEYLPLGDPASRDWFTTSCSVIEV
jgi:hypothetical protein